MDLRLKIQLIVDIILIAGFVLSYFMYRRIKKKQAEDPEYQKRQEELMQEEEYTRRENERLDEYLAQSDAEYDDNNYSNNE